MSKSAWLECLRFYFEMRDVAVLFAQAEARRLGHDIVGTEMLLVGILAEGGDGGFLALEERGAASRGNGGVVCCLSLATFFAELFVWLCL